MMYDITFGEFSEVSITVSGNKITKGIGNNPILNDVVRDLYKELINSQKTTPTIGLGYSEIKGFRNISIYTI